MKKWLAALLTATLLFAMFAPCALAETVTLTLSETAVYVGVGKTATVKATITPKSASKAGATFESSDTGIASVDTHGKVKGVAIGQCKLTVASKSDSSVKQSIDVWVVEPVKSISADDVTMHPGESLMLRPTYLPASATLQQATYESNKEKVATVSSIGTINAVAIGKCNIIIRSLDGNASKRITVNVIQPVESVTLSSDTVNLSVGKKTQLKATVLPKNAGNKDVTWSSADESVAVVDQSGRVTIKAKGSTTVTATSDDSANVKATATVQGIEMSKGVAFESKSYSVLIGEQATVKANVSPASASIQAVSYKSKNPKIATVDENGVVTGVKGGKTIIYAYTTDGSKKRSQTTLTVVVPVQGVSYKSKGLRVGAGVRGSFTAAISPEDATNKNMTWTSSDQSIATVSGTTNKFKVKGRQWGRCSVTGTTEDGGYSITIDVNVGSLRHALSVVTVEIRDGKPYLTLKNKSNMNITQVRYQLRGYDSQFQPVQMSTKTGDTLYGTYDLELEPGAKTRHGNFNFNRHSDYYDLQVLEIAITGWSTDTGYYDNEGTLQYDYDISKKSWEWVKSDTGDLVR